MKLLCRLFGHKPGPSTVVPTIEGKAIAAECRRCKGLFRY